jgi:phosphoglycolate phosphatase
MNVVFDLDGTLIDSAPIVYRLINQMRSELGISALASADLLPLLSLGGEALISGAFSETKVNVGETLVSFRARYADTAIPPDSVYQGVNTVLETLSGWGVRLSVCTNKPRQLALASLRQTGLLHYFSKICAGDDLATRKPNAANLQACLPKNAKGPVFLVGDSMVDQELASNAGVPFIFYSGGYNEGGCGELARKSFSSYECFPFDEFKVSY